ncbi:MAG TPA: hypothetical protein VKC34_01045 [Blastocatellia bacterium]|nr:hypothetical protein [Blastocatellia bacterium]
MSNGGANESGFGKKGKRTARADENAVEVNATAGEHLSFDLTVKGATAIFTFACMHKSHLQASSFPGFPAIDKFTWDWGKKPADFQHTSVLLAEDEYLVRMSFLPAIKYTLVVEQRDKDGNTLKVLKDIDYESQDPTDRFGELLTVFLN